MPIRVPPGRAGRLWLREHLAVARRAADLLGEKRRELRHEAIRLRQLVEDSRARWTAACRSAETWLLRAALVGGEHQLDVAAAQVGTAAEARIGWRSVMGLAYPTEAAFEPGPLADVAGFGDSSALAYAAEAHRMAVAVAVEHAAVERALELVTDELATTVRRHRAIDLSWIPRLEAILHDVEQGLEENEREAIVVARWVTAGGRNRPAGGPTVRRTEERA
jgi:V/A-type H+-transporting ATPase subunit D